MDKEDLIEGQLTLDQQTYDLLSQASKRSFRSLKKEACLRLIDHVQRFNNSPQDRLDEVVFRTSIKLPIRVRKSVVPCLYRGRYKVKTLVDEYSIRLKDHLQRYPTISAVGVVQEEDHAP